MRDRHHHAEEYCAASLKTTAAYLMVCVERGWEPNFRDDDDPNPLDITICAKVVGLDRAEQAGFADLDPEYRQEKARELFRAAVGIGSA